ncbi:MAG: bifunctional alpha/beta hydrolase/OsmC family protein, partial [Burkholderiales bacterium]
RAPTLLVGHSLGGTAVLAAAGAIPEARAVATIGSPFEPAHVLHLLRGGEAAFATADEAEVDIGGRPFRVRRALIDDLRRQSPTRGLAGKALLVMHSPRDTIVSIDNATSIFTAARHPKSFASLDPADHLLTRREDGLYAGKLLAAWAHRYVPDKRPTTPPAVEGTVVVGETREGKFTNHVVAGRHVLRADEPLSAGGLDSGPGPYDYLAAALGACTAMTLRLYADLKKIPLQRVTVEVRHDKIHASDCADCETKEGKVDRLERVIRVEGAIDDAMRAKLLEIADKCPVHRTLQAEITMPTRIEAS